MMHTLEIMMNMQTTQALDSLNKIEDSVLNIVSKVKQLTSELSAAANMSSFSNNVKEVSSAISSASSSASLMSVEMGSVIDSSGLLSDAVGKLSSAFQSVDLSSMDPEVLKNIRSTIDETNSGAKNLSVFVSEAAEAFRDAGNSSQKMNVLSQMSEHAKNADKLYNNIGMLSGQLAKISNEGLNNAIAESLNAVKNVNNEFSLFSNIASSAIDNVNEMNTGLSRPSELQSVNIMDPAQLEAVASLEVSLSAASKRIGEISSKNAEYVMSQKVSLLNAIEGSKGLEHHEGVQAKIAKAQATINQLTRNQNIFISKSVNDISRHSELISRVASTNAENVKLTNKEASELQKIIPILNAIRSTSGDFETDTGLTVKQFENMKDVTKKLDDNFESIVQKHQTWDDLIVKIQGSFEKIDTLVPGISQFGKVLSPFKLLGEELRGINSLYEKNHTVSSVFMKDMFGSYNATSAMATAAMNASDGVALLSETQDALTSILNSGQAASINSSGLMIDLAKSTADVARVTGISGDALADMSTRLTGMSGDISAANELTTAFVNVQSKGRLSSQQMQQMAGLLSRDLSRLNRSFQIVNEEGEVTMSGTAAIAAGMGAMAEAAASAGHSSQAALDLMGRAIEDPMSQAALLGPALMESDPSKQFMMMSERAHMFASQMEGMPAAIQKTFAQKLGTTPEELISLAASTDEYRKAIEGVTDQQEIERIKSQFIEKQRADATDEQNAAAKAAESQENATRQLDKAFNDIRIVFGQLAAAMQPVLSLIAAILSNPIAKWAFIAAGGIVALYTAFKSMKILGGISKLFGTITGSMAKTAKVSSGMAGGKGGGLGKWLSEFVNKLSKINVKGAIKAAASIAIIGTGLAVGIAALGLSLKLMPPNRVGELFVSISGIVATAYLISTLGNILPSAIKGAIGLAIVGSGLAVGIGMIGLALNLMPANKVGELLVVIGGILAATILAAAIGFVFVQALLGAIGLVAVAGALAIGVALLGLSLQTMPEGRVGELLAVIGGILAATVIAAAIGFIIIPALLGAVGLIAVAGALSIGILMIAGAMKKFDGTDANQFIIVTASLLTAMGIVAALGLMFLPALLGAMALVAVSGAIAASIIILSKVSSQTEAVAESIGIIVDSISKISMRSTAALLSLSGGLVAFAVAIAGAGVVGIFFDFTKVSKRLAESLSILYPPLKKLNDLDDPGPLLSSIADGLSKFAGSLKHGGWFTAVPDFAGTAQKLADSINILMEPLRSIGSVQNVDSLSSVGSGLSSFATALDQGNWFGMVPNFTGTANKLASSIGVLAEPLKSLNEIQNPGPLMVAIADGLSKFAESLSQKDGWFSSVPDFVGNANKFAESFKVLLEPFDNMAFDPGMAMLNMANGVDKLSSALSKRINVRNVNELANAVSAIVKPLSGIMPAVSEELRSSLSMNVEASLSKKDEIIVEKLEEIRDAISQQGEDSITVDELKKMNSTLTSLFNEVTMGSSMGTVADLRYNT